MLTILVLLVWTISIYVVGFVLTLVHIAKNPEDPFDIVRIWITSILWPVYAITLLFRESN